MIEEQRAQHAPQRCTTFHERTITLLRRALAWAQRARALVGTTNAVVRGWLTFAAQVAVLIAAVALLLWPTLRDRATLPGGFDGSDLRISHWTSALVIKNSVATEGRLPLWNDVFGGGRPLAADPLAALWYPPTHLVHFLDVRDHFLLLIVGHLVFAGVGMLLLAKHALPMGPGAALIAALAFMATPRLIAHTGAGHLTMLQTVAWFPWAALGTWATVRRPARWTVPFAACLALMLLAGHPQLAYYGGLMIAAVSAWLLIGRRHAHGWRATLGPIAGLAAAGILAVLLAAVYLLPLAEFMAHSTRQRSLASTDAMTLWSFVRALLNYREKSDVPHEALFAPGFGVLALALIGVTARWRQGMPLVLGIGLVGALAMGTASPVYRVIASILPGLDVFRGQGRIWFVGLLGVALLAGMGAQALLQALDRRRRPALLLASIGSGALLVLSLVQASQPFLRIADVSKATTPNAVERTAARIAGAGRIYGVQRNVHQEVAAATGSRLAHGWDPLLIEPYVTFMERAGGYAFDGYPLSVPPYEVYDPGYPTSQDAQPDAALLGLLDVEAVVSSTRLRDEQLQYVTTVGGVRVYRNTANNGAAFLVAAKNNSLPTINSLERAAGSTEIVERHRERLIMRVQSPIGGWLVIGAPAFPGWVARVDGVTVPLETVDGVVPALRLAPGTHDVVYEYRPRSVQIGGALTLVGVGASGAWLAALAIARRRAHRQIKFAAPARPAAETPR